MSTCVCQCVPSLSIHTTEQSRRKHQRVVYSGRAMSPPALLCLPVFVIKVAGRGKVRERWQCCITGWRRLSVQRDVFFLIPNYLYPTVRKLFLSKGAAASLRLQLSQPATVPIVFTTQQHRKWNIHVFTEPKTQAKMDDNPSIVALRHILDRHIMRMQHCFHSYCEVVQTWNLFLLYYQKVKEWSDVRK